MLDVTVVLLDDGLSSTAIMPVEIFHSAGALWSELHDLEVNAPFKVRTVSLDGGVVRSPYGLGLAPEDGALVAAAFQHSAERVWAAIGPLCAQVLRSTPERAAARGPNLCRRLILSDAARKGTALPAFRHAAAYLAGDAPEPSKPSPVEALVLELAQEQDRLKAELAESFGPEEADRLVFSEGLCFTEATHQLDQRQTATHPAATATSQ